MVIWQEREQSKGYLLQGVLLIEAKQFQKERADTFPLSDAARAYIQKSVWHQRYSLLKMASWLIIPDLLIVGIVEYNIRENSIKADISRLDSESEYEEKKAVEALVSGCSAHRRNSSVPKYMAERLWGNCESLSQAPLANANLRAANLSGADLRAASLFSASLGGASLSGASLSGASLSDASLTAADLSGADLRSANLSGASLSGASLRSADLRSADLSGADLRSANLSDAILLSTDLRDSKNLTVEQLNRPLA
ncbi:MAG: pentapeptide repeat-containing protein [Cyanobacteria bacterium P01_F01_bin.53]